MKIKKINRERRNRYKRMLRTAPGRGKHQNDSRRGPEGLWCPICSPWYAGKAEKQTQRGRVAMREAAGG